MLKAKEGYVMVQCRIGKPAHRELKARAAEAGDAFREYILHILEGAVASLPSVVGSDVANATKSSGADVVASCLILEEAHRRLKAHAARIDTPLQDLIAYLLERSAAT